MALTGRGRILQSNWMSRNARRAYAPLRAALYRNIQHGLANTTSRDTWDDWFFEATAAPPPVTLADIELVRMAPMRVPERGLR